MLTDMTNTKQEKEQKRDKLNSDFQSRINFLQNEINNLTLELNAQIKIRQDEIDSLSLQKDALTNFKIT